ncbi:MAG: thiamine diphosphokinase [Ruminococcus sp.]|nr:thiamine diphosphokinase [Ruminococcus sp.]
MNTKKSDWAAIIAGGDLTAPECFSPEDYGTIIAADRGLEHVKKLGITPDIIMGDFDSYTGSLPDNGNIEVIRSRPEKDDTDTMLAVRTALDRGIRHIDLWGGMGGRRFDHTLANLQTLLFAREHGCEMRIMGSDIILLQGAEDGERAYERAAAEKYFSIFSVHEKAEIEYLRGTKYPLEDTVLTNGFPLGVSNEILDDEALLKVRSGVVMVIWRRNTGK